MPRQQPDQPPAANERADWPEEEDLVEQTFGPDPLAVRHTDHYLQEYVTSLAEKWDEIVDWELRATSEGDFFIDLLRRHGAQRVLDVATGTGFHSCRLLAAGFDVTSVDGSPAMLAKAGQNAQARGLSLKPLRADWRHLSSQVPGGFDAIICLGNSFTHLFTDAERRQALAEYHRLLKPGGILVLDQRNYDLILDQGYQSRHIYYYCGRDIVVRPEYMDEGLARFCYVFPDQTTFYLNMCPLRIDYLLSLISQGGFGAIQSYGDFQDPFSREQTEFLVHVATKPNGQEAGA
ncbi:MAG: methyltransferase domain-containing protein [Desulfarculus sp.]|nr:methyltransferase domain-containing protein [Desulfarculus sp.]